MMKKHNCVELIAGSNPCAEWNDNGEVMWDAWTDARGIASLEQGYWKATYLNGALTWELIPRGCWMNYKDALIDCPKAATK